MQSHHSAIWLKLHLAYVLRWNRGRIFTSFHLFNYLGNARVSSHDLKVNSQLKSERDLRYMKIISFMKRHKFLPFLKLKMENSKILDFWDSFIKKKWKPKYFLASCLQSWPQVEKIDKIVRCPFKNVFWYDRIVDRKMYKMYLLTLHHNDFV